MMNKILKYSAFVIILLITGIMALAPTADKKVDELPIGAEAPMTDVEVKDVSGTMLTLGKVAEKNGLLVIFSCNTCPWVKRWEDRFNPVAGLAEKHDIGTIFLNPNAGYREKGDSFEEMKQRAAEEEYEFYYALDKDGRIAKAFGASRTPHVFLFDGNMELVYRGAIDDNAGSAEEVENHYLKNAIKELAMGEEISVKTSKSLGCTIKWSE